MTDRSHLSIGEVLSLLQDDFPDVTISKIRFLESQGLMDPERTPSGYRKFYEADIDRLRWVLRQQRDNFLPLKVIKERLDRNGGTIPPDDDFGPDQLELMPEERLTPAGGPSGPTTGSQPFVDPAAAPPAPAPSSRSAPPAAPPTAHDEPVWMQDHARRVAARGGDEAARRAEPAATRPPAASPSTPVGAEVSTMNLNQEELLRAAGLTEAQLRSLEQFGLVKGRQVGPELLYDGETVLVAQRSAAFLARGIEARHLRMFKVAAEREAGFLEQVVTPLLKQRNPGARQQAVDLLGELIELGDALHGALLRHSLHDYLHPPV
ncbi:MAG TPA: MerR family transcriptional regulator [Acidimicrobiales bacterium]|nr:MerR family transcriptional regulator [Acidimicrobiales bacterium]